MIEKIIPDRISLTLPTVFGEELTFLEFCGKLRAKLNECIDVVNEDTANIQQNTTDIQQNTSAISANESNIATLNTAFNLLQYDFRNKKVESLFAPVILNVENHEAGADINASVYIRLGRIDWQGLGCLYAKVNISFSGATDAKTLKINSVQFGDRKVADITSVSTSFTAKTDVINLPISVVGSADVPVGTSDISVTGINLLGMSIVAESLASSFSLDSIPTGIDIPCESLAFTSPGGGESDPKLVHTLKFGEGCIDIFTASAGFNGLSSPAHMDIDFTSTMSDPIIYDQFLSSRGVFDDDTVSKIPESGAALGSALINHTGYTDNEHTYTARICINCINDDGSPLYLKSTGVAEHLIPFGKTSHTSLTFDMLNFA